MLHVDSFSVSAYLLFSALLAPLGSDVQRAGTKVTARGKVNTPTGKQAVAAMLEPQVAFMQADGEPSVTNVVGGKPKPKPKPKAKKNPDSEEEKAKQLQKDIKQYLVKKTCLPSYAVCHRMHLDSFLKHAFDETYPCISIYII